MLSQQMANLIALIAFTAMWGFLVGFSLLGRVVYRLSADGRRLFNVGLYMSVWYLAIWCICAWRVFA